jgi:6-phosphogluconolactonase
VLLSFVTFVVKKLSGMESIIKIFTSPNDLAIYFAESLVKMVNESARENKPFTIALSGGSTPELLFRILAEKFSTAIPWQYVHFFWGDERCVRPDDPESNFGMTSKTLLSHIDIPAENIHRIIGEADPVAEAARYSHEILKFAAIYKGIISFNMLILGLGEDGHTASIFPGHLDLFDSDKICEVAVHPLTHQKRITITGPVINNAERITFLVTGKKKAPIVEKMFKKDPDAKNYPAAYTVPVFGQLTWLLDKDAAMYVSG